MKSFSKLLAVLLAVLMMVSLCGSFASAEEDVLVIPQYVSSSQWQRSDETVVGQYVRDNFGIVFEYVEYVGSMIEKQVLQLASGDYNKLQWTQDNTTLQAYLNAGKAIALDDYLDQMPNFVKRFEQSIPYWRATSPDGKLYNWDTNVPSKTDCFDMFVRSDLLEQANWEVPLTTSEWYDFLVKAQESNPVSPITGEPAKAISLPGAESWGMLLFGLLEKGEYLEWMGGFYVLDTRDDNLYGEYELSETKESAAFFNSLYRAGCFDEECFTDLADDLSEKMINGTVMSGFYCNWLVSGVNKALKENGYENLSFVKLPIMLDSQAANGEKRGNTSAYVRPFNSVIITDKCSEADIAKIIKFIDWACSDEGQIILCNGPEGECWYRDENGVRQYTDKLLEYSMDAEANKEMGLRVMFVPEVVPEFSGIVAEDGKAFDLWRDSSVSDIYSLNDREREVYNKIGWETSTSWYDENMILCDRGASESISIDTDSDLGKTRQAIKDVRNQYLPQLLIAETEEEFEATYQELLDAWGKLDWEGLMTEYNRQYHETMAVVRGTAK